MNLERIVALKPDLVIAWRGGNAERQVDQLASLGIKVMWVDATSIEQIANALRQLAPSSPQPDKAEQAAQSLPIVYAGGRYHVAVGSVGAAVLYLKHLALFGSCRLNTLTRCLSSLLVLWVSLHFSRTAWRCSGEAD